MEERVEPGVYRHYKGGLYVVLNTAVHHDTRRTYVAYVSMTTGDFTIRPLRGFVGDKDGFLDDVEFANGESVERFVKVPRPEPT